MEYNLTHYFTKENISSHISIKAIGNGDFKNKSLKNFYSNLPIGPEVLAVVLWGVCDIVS